MSVSGSSGPCRTGVGGIDEPVDVHIRGRHQPGRPAHGVGCIGFSQADNLPAVDVPVAVGVRVRRGVPQVHLRRVCRGGRCRRRSRKRCRCRTGPRVPSCLFAVALEDAVGPGPPCADTEAMRVDHGRDVADRGPTAGRGVLYAATFAERGRGAGRGGHRAVQRADGWCHRGRRKRVASKIATVARVHVVGGSSDARRVCARQIWKSSSPSAVSMAEAITGDGRRSRPAGTVGVCALGEAGWSSTAAPASSRAFGGRQRQGRVADRDRGRLRRRRRDGHLHCGRAGRRLGHDGVVGRRAAPARWPALAG